MAGEHTAAIYAEPSVEAPDHKGPRVDGDDVEAALVVRRAGL